MSVESISRESSHRNPLLLAVRVLLYWLIKTAVLLYLGLRILLRPRLVRYGLLMLLVAAGVAWKSGVWTTTLPSSARDAGHRFSLSVATDVLPSPAVVGEYFAAQAEYDASRMWETMSDKLKQKMMVSNNTKEQIQKELNNSRQQGRRYGSVTYVGGQPLDGGRSVYFYVLVVEAPSSVTRLPYSFVVEHDGKISNIQWSL